MSTETETRGTRKAPSFTRPPMSHQIAVGTQPEIQGGHDGFSITSIYGQGGQRCAKSLPTTSFGVTVLKQGGHLRSVENRLLTTWSNIRTRKKVHARANLAPAWMFFPCFRRLQEGKIWREERRRMLIEF